MGKSTSIDLVANIKVFHCCKFCRPECWKELTAIHYIQPPLIYALLSHSVNKINLWSKYVLTTNGFNSCPRWCRRKLHYDLSLGGENLVFFFLYLDPNFYNVWDGWWKYLPNSSRDYLYLLNNIIVLCVCLEKTIINQVTSDWPDQQNVNKNKTTYMFTCKLKSFLHQHESLCTAGHAIHQGSP